MSNYLNSTRRSIAWLKKTHDDTALEIKPPFQRNPVWTEAQKSFLLDSILRGYPIPELYIQETVSDKGREIHTVVDGQQRVRACLEFVENKFALDADQAPEWPDMKFKDLTPEDRQKVFSYNFIVRQLPPVPEAELRNVFQRLNRNVVALNRQELRHATYSGKFLKCMEAIAEQEWWSTSGLFTANDIRRMLDIEYISEIAVAVLHGVQNKKQSLDEWYPTYEREFPDQSHVQETFRTVLGELSQVIPVTIGTRWAKKSDFYSLFLTFAAHAADLPLSKKGRRTAGQLLRSLSEEVDAYLREGRTRSTTARKYGDAVERAASDLANRRARGEQLEHLLKDIWHM